jgi:hypothetical protein
VSPSWRTMLEGAREEALLAVDLYNQARQPRRLEAFLVHMHIAWTYLLHAEFRRDGIDIRCRMTNGHFDRIDGEPKTWGLAQCIDERWPIGGPVKRNLEITIGLRNKIEHRFHEAVTLATGGYAQSLLVNFEEELTSVFDPKYSLGEELRFPIFVGAITALGNARMQELRSQLPASTRDYLARFEAGLDPAIVSDRRFEFRINLIPKLGSKTDADQALTFVRETDLSEDQKAAMEGLGKSGTVVIREQYRAVSNAGMLRPAVVVAEVAQRIPFGFNMYHFTQAWKALKCRPPSGDKYPSRTEEKYCVFDEPHGDYMYKPAFVEKIVRETTTAEKFKAFLKVDPRSKS